MKELNKVITFLRKKIQVPVPVSRMAEVCLMTQSERWQMQYDQVMAFIATNHRRPSKYYAEERLLWHWLRRNIKLMSKGDLPIERKEKFEALIALDEKYRRVNQFK